MKRSSSEAPALEHSCVARTASVLPRAWSTAAACDRVCGEERRCRRDVIPKGAARSLGFAERAARGRRPADRQCEPRARARRWRPARLARIEQSGKALAALRQASTDRPAGSSSPRCGPLPAQVGNQMRSRMPQPVIFGDGGGFSEQREPFGAPRGIVRVRRALESRGQRRPQRLTARLGGRS